MAENVRVKDKGWNKLTKQMKSASGKGKWAQVGIQGAEAGQAIAEHQFNTNVELAVVHEFGTRDGKIPSRPFLRSTFDINQKKYEKAVEKATGKLVDGKKLEGELFLVGEQHRMDIINRVRSDPFQGLAASTLKKRGTGVPLWDTGQLIGSLTTVIKP